MLIAAPAAAQDVQRGGELFQGHCAACHGADAQGAGPMTAILEVSPPDLTTLASVEGGAFPMSRIVRTIDGRDLILSHGGPMPLFGMLLRDDSAVVDGEDGTPIITKQSVVDIATWLASVQR
jgi:mono/diheme cytochrome c family protein